ncbi:hypothetical protein HBH98_072170 [Parastagonospora nodorum]|nr:hypothetical protein HBH98_072170 [Parastagonospora nodorum]KAH4391695.1 hypothetical protein HBH97_039820 [Parastagonospora nodorum]KAH5312316.1 hypothetical protein HBI12_140610 [Parastagonospora nodorum]KAH5368056.1 hypothetical protein HBI48_057560 [Parastagonospora nodorum]KAH5516596.1 hypothetical protein HBI29_085160 [Parastagonospora nodorum]
MPDPKLFVSSSKKSPFAIQSTVSTKVEATYPATFWDGTALLDPQETPHIFLRHDLLTPKLDAIYERLWLAGLTRRARPLHRQKMLQRTIRITESADEHLVWHKYDIFIKPLPIYLLDYEYWEEHLCTEGELYASAAGLLLSYVWLIASITDYSIAVEERILPASVSWEAWQTLARDIVREYNTLIAQVDRRYHYGELRLSRLNTLCRFNRSIFSPRNIVYDYMSTPTWYTQFFERNFSWIFAAFIYVTVILSAMQVGLATSHLQNNATFQNISYGVAHDHAFKEGVGEAKYDAKERLMANKY